MLSTAFRRIPKTAARDGSCSFPVSLNNRKPWVCYFTLLTLVFGLSLLPSDADARDVSHGTSWTSNKRAADILKVITDFQNQCDKGCKYEAPSVVRQVVLTYKKKPNDFFIWTEVADIIDSNWFSRVKVSRLGHKTIVRQSMAKESDIKALEKASGLKSDPVLDECKVTYTFTEIFDKTGKFIKSHVTFSAIVTATGLVGILEGPLKGAMVGNAEATKNNLRK